MALFLDSSDPKETREIFSWGVVSGVTTNPLIISREAPDADLKERILEVVAVSTGHVSVELTTETEAEMLAEGLGYFDWNRERICVKVPFSEVGLKVLKQLADRKVPTNVTCMMSFNQAYLAALAGVTDVSIFSGRVKDMGYDVRSIVREKSRILDRERLASMILVGSVRHMMDVNEARWTAFTRDRAAAHLAQDAVDPWTETTIAEFNDAWANRKKK